MYTSWLSWLFMFVSFGISYKLIYFFCVLIIFVFASFVMSYNLVHSFVFNNFFLNKMCFITLGNLYIITYIF